MTNRLTIRRIALVLMFTAGAAMAQVPPAPSDDALYRAFGGQDGLVKLIDDFMLRLLADRRMNPFFKDVNQQQVKSQLVVQICEVTGGPCKLKGPCHTPILFISTCTRSTRSWTGRASLIG